MDINDELREGVIALARQAAEAILAVYESSDFAVQEKSDHSPLTAADMAFVNGNA